MDSESKIDLTPFLPCCMKIEKDSCSDNYLTALVVNHKLFMSVSY